MIRLFSLDFWDSSEQNDIELYFRNVDGPINWVHSDTTFWDYIEYWC